MDVFSLIIMSLALLIGAFAGTFAVGMIVSGVSNAQLQGRLNKLEGKMYSAAGVEAKAEKGQRMQAALIEAAQIMKDENIPKEEKTKALMGLAAKYPDVAMDLVKKVGINGLL